MDAIVSSRYHLYIEITDLVTDKMVDVEPSHTNGLRFSFTFQTQYTKDQLLLTLFSGNRIPK